MWCSRALGHFIVCLRCLILMLYTIAGCTSEGQCVPSEVDFERYLSWPDIVCFFMLFFRSRLWTLFVVDPCTFGVHCLLSEVGFCYCFTFRRTSTVSSCFPSEVDFERYLSRPELLLEVQSLIFNIFLMILRLRSKIFNFLLFSYDFNIQKRYPVSNSRKINDLTIV